MRYGSGKHTYELQENWIKPQKDVSFADVAGICFDEKDYVYVLNRSLKHTVMVFDNNGNFERSWGEGLFPAHMAPVRGQTTQSTVRMMVTTL